jgi:outer membrane lipoprotein-sorting protein
MLKNSKLTVPLLLGTLLCTALHAAPLKILSLDFTRELTENNKTERTAGALHYDVKAARVVIEVTEPLKQIMVVQDKVLEIYYPVKQQAFRFIFQGRVPLPFVESIIHSTQVEYGLTAIGYTLAKHDVVDDVLYTYWTPPEQAKDKLGTVILGMREDRLVSTQVKNPKGDIIARARYQNHSKIGIHFIPMTVISNTYGTKSEVSQHERIVYSNPQVNAESPNPILNFTIPESVKVKVIKW